MKEPQFEIQKIYQEEALRLQSARRSGKIIHTAGDIPASGDEVETAFREFLQRRLPSKFHVGHGHIVDQNIKVSPQLDVIISDSSACPILFEGEKGTKFYPYESVYAFAEVKTTYVHSKRFIESFAETRRSILTNLTREKTPPNYLGSGLALGPGFSLSGVDSPYRNPPFSFIVFIDSGDSNQKRLLSEYSASPDEHLPNVACFLDGAVISKCGLSLTETAGFRVDSIVMNSHRIQSDQTLYWIKLNFNDSGLRGGYALAHLMLGLFDHLNSCVLMPPPIREYMKKILQGALYVGEPMDLRIGEKLGFKLPPNWREAAGEIFDSLQREK